MIILPDVKVGTNLDDALEDETLTSSRRFWKAKFVTKSRSKHEVVQIRDG